MYSYNILAADREGDALDALIKIFPLSENSTKTSALVTSVIIYVAASLIANIIFAFLSWVPVVSVVLSVVSTLVGIYCIAGVILCIVVFVKSGKGA